MPPSDVRRGRRRHPPSRESAARARPAGQASGEVQRGVIKWFNREKGYGFIRCHGGAEVFVHESALILGTNDLALAKGREVEFEVRQTARGSQAFSVVVLGEADIEVQAEELSAVAGSLPESGSSGAEQPQATTDPPLDFSRRLPASWQSRPAAFVYTYTIYGPRGD